MDSGSADLAAALRRVGLRVTASRSVVQTALAERAPHSGVDAVVGAVRERLGDGLVRTVYNVLRAFTGVGLVRRIKPAGRPGLYAIRASDTLCLTATNDLGYESGEAEVVYRNRRPGCGAATSVSSGELERIGSVRHSLGSGAARVESKARSEGTWREEQDRRV